MILNEQEAKTKWCPMVRVSNGVNEVVNRGSIDDDRCLASGCMAWCESVSGSGKGYCGIAGK